MGREYPLHPVPAVAAVVLSDDDGSVLLVRRANPPARGEWFLPGGVLELGETLEAGMVREVLEETGMLVEPVAFLEVLDSIVKDASGRILFHYVLIDFFCRVRSGVLLSASDALEACWFTREQLETSIVQLPLRTLQVIQKAFGLAAEGRASCSVWNQGSGRARSNGNHARHNF